MPRRHTLRRRIAFGLIGYVLLLTAAVVIHGLIVNESVESLVWRSMLEAELDFFLKRRAEDPGYPWPRTETLDLFIGGTGAAVPEPLAALAPGMHDEVAINDHQVAALIRDVEGERIYLVLDITDLELQERQLALGILVSALVAIVLLAAAAAWMVGRLTRPLSSFAQTIHRLQPARHDQRIGLPEGASEELAVIAGAMNDYLERNARFVERERAFIHSASHELRTPIAVIAGAAELAAARPDLSAAARAPLQRIVETARGIEQLIGLLLVLAKDPDRLLASSDRLALDHLLPEIVEDHRHLTRDKSLDIRLGNLAHCELEAPLQIVQAAIGNLLRNAIENSDRGEIQVQMEPAGVVTIDDPGHGMSPEEISRLYALIARSDGRAGAGIGLDLIGRICEHLGWSLRIESREGLGTRATLDLRSSLAAPAEAPA